MLLWLWRLIVGHRHNFQVVSITSDGTWTKITSQCSCGAFASTTEHGTPPDWKENNQSD